MGALVLPVAWLSRPRREPRTAAQWAFNLGALASVLTLLAASAAWVRSYWVSEQWMFASRSVEPPAAMYVPVRAQSWVDSAHGRVMFSTYENPEAPHFASGPARGVGYRRGIVARSPAGIFATAMIAKDQRRWSIPGIQYAAMPVQELTGPGPTPGTRYVAFYGYRHLVVAWWAPVVVSAVLPVIWTWRHWGWRRRARRVAAKLCVKCGYDLRASAVRCPECGAEIAA
jgi:hypothetical protein